MKHDKWNAAQLMVRWVALIFSSLALPSGSCAQQPPLQQSPAEPNLPVLRASSRLTLVDVTAVDSKGQPIEGVRLPRL
jgi:hypothetical protein